MNPPIILPYRLEVDHGRPLNPDAPSGWHQIAQDNSKLYLEGLAEGWTSKTPRLAVRLVRAKDGKVCREWPASNHPPVGMVAGWATTGQLIRAAVECLDSVGRHGDPPTEDEADAVRVALAQLRRVTP